MVAAAQVCDAIAEQGVGEEPNTVEVDEDGGMADVLDARPCVWFVHIAILRRRLTAERCGPGETSTL